MRRHRPPPDRNRRRPPPAPGQGHPGARSSRAIPPPDHGEPPAESLAIPREQPSGASSRPPRPAHRPPTTAQPTGHRPPATAQPSPPVTAQPSRPSAAEAHTSRRREPLPPRRPSAAPQAHRPRRPIRRANPSPPREPTRRASPAPGRKHISGPQAHPTAQALPARMLTTIRNRRVKAVSALHSPPQPRRAPQSFTNTRSGPAPARTTRPPRRAGGLRWRVALCPRRHARACLPARCPA